MTRSIEKHRKNSYRVVVFKGYDLDGKSIRYQKTIHCKNKSEAQIKLAKFVADIQNGMVIDGKSLKFSEFTELWKRDYGSKELAPSTYKRYLGISESRILPYFGHFYINKIKPTDIMQFYDLLSRDTKLVRKKNNNGNKTLKPLFSKTVLEHYRLLRAMLYKAIYWQMIVSNPAERVQPPKAKKPKRRYYNDEHCKILLENLTTLGEDQIKYKIAIILTVFIGVRLGELMGLKWQDVDFKEGLANITKASQYTSEKGIFVRYPKTYSSIIKVGHSSVQTTDRVYFHFFEDEFKDVANVMEESLTVKTN